MSDINSLILNSSELIEGPGLLKTSWEDALLAETADFSKITDWLIWNKSKVPEDIQGYHSLSEWIKKTPTNIINSKSEWDILASEDISKRYIQNSKLVINELVTNAFRSSGGAKVHVEAAFLVTNEGVLVSITDNSGTLQPEAFFKALRPGPKSPQTADPKKGAGLGLSLVLKYASTILIERQAGKSNRVSLFIPARPDGTKLFYFKQI